MARKKGAVNYKNNLLISIIKELLPNGELGWQAVAAEYQKASKEDCERDSTDVKKHWIKNLCNGMKKPTGSTGEKTDRVHQCIAIEKQILDKTNSGLLGISSDDEDEGGGTNNESVHVFDVEGVRRGKRTTVILKSLMTLSWMQSLVPQMLTTAMNLELRVGVR